MTRSVWKGPFVEPSLIKRFIISGLPAPKGRHLKEVRSSTFVPLGSHKESLLKPGRPLGPAPPRQTSISRKVWSRRSTIVPQFVGWHLVLYNGRKWIALKVTEEMVGHKFGEFASTRTIGSQKFHATSKTRDVKKQPKQAK